MKRAYINKNANLHASKNMRVPSDNLKINLRMKKYIPLIAVGFMLFFTACESFLEEENYSSVVADELYATKSGYDGLVNACYSSLRTIYGDEVWLFCAGTDMYVEGRGAQPEGISEYANLTPTDTYVRDFFRNLYKTIQLCNTAVEYNSKTEAAATLPQRLAEVRFLRAFAYFKLVQHFGGVSIVEEMIDEPITSFERKSAEEVYAFIIAEIEAAKANLPETTSDFGRATRRAADHYLAKVYLTRGYETFGKPADFTTAAGYADAAINNQGLNLSYETVFKPGNEKNEEIIFSLQYDPASIVDAFTDGHRQSCYFGPAVLLSYPQTSVPSKAYVLCPTMYVFNLYTQHDSRWEASFMNVIYDRYYDYFDKPAERNNLVVADYYPQSWEVADIEAWKAASPLRANARIYPYGPAWEASPASNADRLTPSVKKFDDPTSVYSWAGSNTRDIFLARLGETYLLAAEAYLKANDPAKAAARINAVRTRAAKAGHTAQMQLTAGQMTIDKILDERALELIGEYHRWEDLKRTGTLVDRTKIYNRDIKDWFDNGSNPFMGSDGKLKILRPIPQEALDLNQDETYVQNPGY